jgi:hypothetical protein
MFLGRLFFLLSIFLNTFLFSSEYQFVQILKKKKVINLENTFIQGDAWMAIADFAYVAPLTVTTRALQH